MEKKYSVTEYPVPDTEYPVPVTGYPVTRYTAGFRPDMKICLPNISGSGRIWKTISGPSLAANRGKFRKKNLKKNFFEKISCFVRANRASCAPNRESYAHEARSTKSDRPRHDRPRARNPIVYEARSSPPRQSWRVRRIRSVGSATESLFRGLYTFIVHVDATL